MPIAEIVTFVGIFLFVAIIAVNLLRIISLLNGVSTNLNVVLGHLDTTVEKTSPIPRAVQSIAGSLQPVRSLVQTLVSKLSG